MLILTVAIILVAIAAGSPHGRRVVKNQRLRLAAARQERDALALRAREDAAAFIEAQKRYFIERGIRIADSESTPRAADLGSVHLEHHKESRWQSDDDGSWHSQPIVCDYGCGAAMIFVSEITPLGGEGSGVRWMKLGRYCAACGACSLSGRRPNGGACGPLEGRMYGATNIFDVMGNPTRDDPEAEWHRLETEEADLEARLNRIRARRLGLAERLGKPMLGGPMRLELPAKTGT